MHNRSEHGVDIANASVRMIIIICWSIVSISYTHTDKNGFVPVCVLLFETRFGLLVDEATIIERLESANRRKAIMNATYGINERKND